jgi:hypothetical protein
MEATNGKLEEKNVIISTAEAFDVYIQKLNSLATRGTSLNVAQTELASMRSELEMATGGALPGFE